MLAARQRSGWSGCDKTLNGFCGTELGILDRPSAATLAVWFSLSQAKDIVSLAARVCSNTIVAECGAPTRHG
jgi:hypothetical protein